MNEAEFREFHKDDELVEDEKPAKGKKIAVFSIGFILVILMVSYIFVSYPVGRIIRGQVESDPLENNVITLNTFSIIFEDDSEKKLQEFYFDEQQVEISVCLEGEKRGDDYYITSLYKPKVFEQAFNHVSFEPCSAETVVMLHTHPYKSCLASDTDIKTLRQTQQRNPEVLMVVMCEPDRFSVYS